MPSIITLVEKKRGCGFRKPGGFYLLGSRRADPCCKLPIPLTDCPCCGSRIKFSRSFQWISGKLLGSADCDLSWKEDKLCPLVWIKEQRLGLMWVGRAFYETPQAFQEESERMGISKRIKQLPKDCKIGTWVALAHMAAMPDGSPGIFQVFRVTGIDYVVTGQESDEMLADLEKKGIRPVRVEREGDPVSMGLGFDQVDLDQLPEVPYPGETTALWDEKTDTYWNRAGQKLKRPENYHPDNDGRYY